MGKKPKWLDSTAQLPVRNDFFFQQYYTNENNAHCGGTSTKTKHFTEKRKPPLDRSGENVKIHSTLHLEHLFWRWPDGTIYPKQSRTAQNKSFQKSFQAAHFSHSSETKCGSAFLGATLMTSSSDRLLVGSDDVSGKRSSLKYAS